MTFGLNEAVVDGLPAPIDFAIAFRLGTQADELPQSARLTFEVLDTGGAMVFQHAGPVQLHSPTGIIEETEIFTDEAMPFQFIAYSTGLHTIKIGLDGEPAAEFALRIIHGDLT